MFLTTLTAQCSIQRFNGETNSIMFPVIFHLFVFYLYSGGSEETKTQPINIWRETNHHLAFHLVTSRTVNCTV